MNALSPFEIDRKVETLAPEKPLLHPELNETQLVLKRALELLGPNGERWTQQRAYVCDAGYCAIGAVGSVMQEDPHDVHRAGAKHRIHRLLMEAIGGHQEVTLANDAAKSFSEVRTMFLRAIELAA